MVINKIHPYFLCYIKKGHINNLEFVQLHHQNADHETIQDREQYQKKNGSYSNK